MNSTSRSIRIGYLAFYVDYYEGISAEFPSEKETVARRCAEALQLHGEVIWDGQLIRDRDVADGKGRQLAREKVDCVVVVATIAIFSAIPWAAVKHLSCPIIIWSAQQIRTAGRNYAMVDVVRHTGQIGAQALANTLLREGRWFRVVVGHERNRLVTVRLGRLCATIRSATAVRRARLLAIGEPFPMMTDIALDQSALRRHLGTTVTRVTSGEFTSLYRAITPSRVRRAEETMRRRNRLKELTPDEVSRSSRLCATLESLAKERGAAGGTLNCHSGSCLRNLEIGITACYSLGIQNSQGRPFTCTGDLPTAIAMLILKNLAGVSMYTEVQVIDEERRGVVIANNGEGEGGMRRDGCRPIVRGNCNFKGPHGRGAAFAYPLRTGRATLVSFTPSPQGARPFRLIVAEGRILQATLPGVGGLAGFFRFSHTDVSEGYTRWLEAGAVHHAATCTGHWGRELGDIADLLNLQFVKI